MFLQLSHWTFHWFTQPLPICHKETHTRRDNGLPQKQRFHLMIFIAAVPPHHDVKSNVSCNVCGLYLVEWMSICVDLKQTSRDDSRWRIVGRRTAAQSHTPSRRSVPHSWSFRAPPRTVCRWPVWWYVRFRVAAALRGSTVTAECGSGPGNKQDSWVESLTLIAPLGSTTLVRQFIYNLYKCTPLNLRPYLRD